MMKIVQEMMMIMIMIIVDIRESLSTQHSIVDKFSRFFYACDEFWPEPHAGVNHVRRVSETDKRYPPHLSCWPS